MTMRAFTVQRPEPVPAVAWLPDAPATATVLLGHGGGLSKDAPSMVRLGERLATDFGYAAVAIDLPYHGDRMPEDERGLTVMERRLRVGLAAWRTRNASATEQAVADWRATLDEVQTFDGVGTAPVGYYGLSMGTRFGVPLLASEPRIAVAALGLFGLGPGGDGFEEHARAVRVPVLFLQQWDDELMPRDDASALFDRLGSKEKTLHANPGGHLDVPRAELRYVVEFLAQHLSS